MGIFSKIFGKSTPLKQPADNFEYIAMNLAFIFHLLKKNHGNRVSSESDLLLISGVIDMIKYLQEGSITVEDIRNGLMASKQDRCRLGPTTIQHENGTRSMFVGVEDPLLNFTIQIEAMIFAVDKPGMDAKRIINAVLSKKADIQRTLQDTAVAAQSGPFPPGVPELVDGFMTADEFSDLRQQIGIH
ncbi:MAG: hypothetical protein P9M00_00115 [Candidatus Tritonobacter lacicola]|nr:hypothetical protein [Candidatus Tritonobacter lacicola]